MPISLEVWMTILYLHIEQCEAEFFFCSPSAYSCVPWFFLFAWIAIFCTKHLVCSVVRLAHLGLAGAWGEEAAPHLPSHRSLISLPYPCSKGRGFKEVGAPPRPPSTWKTFPRLKKILSFLVSSLLVGWLAAWCTGHPFRANGGLHS